MQTKENRLLSQLEYVKDEQQTIINEELQNLEEIAPLIDKSMNENKICLVKAWLNSLIPTMRYKILGILWRF